MGTEAEMRVAAFCVVLLASYATAAPRLAPMRPNIIWIMADDMGWGEPELYNSTSPHGRIHTPNLNEFGKGGIQFTQSYAGYTVCAPSRTTLMTGFHSGHFGREGLPGTSIPKTKKILTTQEMLQKAGYATAGIGKMAPLTAPTAQGFDHFIGQVDQGLCHNMYPRKYDTGDGTQNVNLTLNWKVPNSAGAARTACMANPELFNYTVDITHQHSMAWLQDHVSKQQARLQAGQARQPFYLYESFTVPHAGGWGHAPSTPESGAPVPTDGVYANQSWPEVERDHAAVITYLDAYVGDLLKLLKTLGVEEETVVFFASDNGAHLEGGHDYRFFNSTGGLLGHKRSLYEGGMRSPTMVRWPGTIKPGVISDFQWAFWDFMPTAAELSGGTSAPGIDGVSIVPTLMGETQAPKPYVYFTWPGPHSPAPPPTPPGPPVTPSAISGLWCQGKLPITISVEEADNAVTITPCAHNGNSGKQGNPCKSLRWTSGSGNISTGATGTTMRIAATGKGSFETGEIGSVSAAPGGGLVIQWKPDGGAERRWTDWHKAPAGVKGHAAPLPEGWQAWQTPEGLLSYYHAASGRRTAVHPAASCGSEMSTRHDAVAATKKKGPSGYAIRGGDWKGVVNHCADSKAKAPSDADVYEVYNLAADPFEQHDLASTPEGAKQRGKLLATAKAAGVSCACFQC